MGHGSGSASRLWWIWVWVAALVVAIVAGLAGVGRSDLAVAASVVAVLGAMVVRPKRPTPVAQPVDQSDPSVRELRAIRNLLSILVGLVLLGALWWWVDSQPTEEERMDKAVCEIIGRTDC